MLLRAVALVFQNHYDWEKAFRRALFQVATAHTSCGFATDDYNLWPSFTWMLLIFAMLSGGCTGSTSGGIKNMRLMILARNIKNEFILFVLYFGRMDTADVFRGGDN